MSVFRSLKIAVLGYAVMIAGCDKQSDEAAQPPLASEHATNATSSAKDTLNGVIDRSHRGAPLPDITLKDAQGQELALSTLQGQPTLINLWATWCAPCVIELPMLNELAQRTDPKIRVITVSQDMGKPEEIAGFLQERGLSHLPAWLDPNNDLAFHYATGTLPTTIYYDAQGKEVWRFVGAHDWSNDETRKMLEETEN